jgi:pentatricopeptide repeat protein
MNEERATLFFFFFLLFSETLSSIILSSNYRNRITMLKLYSITRPLYSASILQRSVDIPLLGTRYRLLSTTPPKPGKQYDLASEAVAVDRLTTLVRLKKYEDLFSILKVETSLPYKAFQGVLRYKFGVSPVRDIEIKEKIVEIMEKRGMVLDAGSISHLISRYGKMGDFKKADAMLQTMKDNGIERTAVVYTSLIKCHERDLSKVDSLFKEMIEEGIKPDEVTYNTMIKCHERDLLKVDSLFKEMIEEGIKPMKGSYNLMIDACSKGGDFDKAVELFSRMKEEGINPDSFTFKKMKIMKRERESE